MVSKMKIRVKSILDPELFHSGLYPTCLSSRWCTFNLLRSGKTAFVEDQSSTGEESLNFTLSNYQKASSLSKSRFGKIKSQGCLSNYHNYYMIYSKPAVYVQLYKTRSNLVFPYMFHLFLSNSTYLFLPTILTGFICFYLIAYLFLSVSLPVSICFLACFFLVSCLFLSVSLPVPDHSPFIDPALLALSRLGVPGKVR